MLPGVLLRFCKQYRKFVAVGQYFFSIPDLNTPGDKYVTVRISKMDFQKIFDDFVHFFGVYLETAQPRDMGMGYEYHFMVPTRELKAIALEMQEAYSHTINQQIVNRVSSAVPVNWN